MLTAAERKKCCRNEEALKLLVLAGQRKLEKLQMLCFGMCDDAAGMNE